MSSLLPSSFAIESLLRSWLLEDLGRGDHTTAAITAAIVGHKLSQGSARWILKEAGVVAGLPIALQVFRLLDPEMQGTFAVPDGQACPVGTELIIFQGDRSALLTGERVALNLAMRLSGIATLTRAYVDCLADLPCQLVDTRKTTPGLRILEKYASQVGGAKNHRLGLDDAIMIKDNHIVAAGGILAAIEAVRQFMPYPLSIEVETENLDQVREALRGDVDVIMLDNMPLESMREAVQHIRSYNPRIKIEASGNMTLDRLRSVAETGVDFISTSAPITRSSWLDLSMRMI